MEAHQSSRVDHMHCYPICLALAAIPFVLTFARSQDSLVTAQDRTPTPSVRLLVEKGFFDAHSNGGDQSGYQYSFAVGSVPRAWWHTSFHLWFTYDEYHYFRGWLTSERKDMYLVGIYPSVKLLSCLLIGYGCSFGNRTQERWSLFDYPVPTHTYSTGWSQKWSPLVGVDINVYVVYNFYLATSILVREPVSVASLGVAKTF
jgi:hypothetical protein